MVDSCRAGLQVSDGGKLELKDSRIFYAALPLSQQLQVGKSGCTSALVFTARQNPVIVVPTTLRSLCNSRMMPALNPVGRSVSCGTVLTPSLDSPQSSHRELLLNDSVDPGTGSTDANSQPVHARALKMLSIERCPLCDMHTLKRTGNRAIGQGGGAASTSHIAAQADSRAFLHLEWHPSRVTEAPRGTTRQLFAN